jgi:ArsR family transcriptional regulator, arsenate/arsenite/antimonite-responsive transcriptional repressor
MGGNVVCGIGYPDGICRLKDRMGVPIDQLERTFTQCAPLFFAMGDAMRQKIILLLATTEEMNVSAFTEVLPLSRPAISHHLKILRQAGLIQLRKSGNESFYALCEEPALELLKRFIYEIENCEL